MFSRSSGMAKTGDAAVMIGAVDSDYLASMEYQPLPSIHKGESILSVDRDLLVSSKFDRRFKIAEYLRSRELKYSHLGTENP